MRRATTLLILALTVLRAQAWTGLILCIHPDGRGYVEYPDYDCCRPCDSGKTHCSGTPAPGSPGDASEHDTHCEDYPLESSLPAVVFDAQRRQAEVRTIAQADLGIVLEESPLTPARGGLSAPESRDPAPDVRLARLRSVVLRC